LICKKSAEAQAMEATAGPVDRVRAEIASMRTTTTCKELHFNME